MLEKTQTFSRAESTVKFGFGKTAVFNNKATASQEKSLPLFIVVSIYFFAS